VNYYTVSIANAKKGFSSLLSGVFFRKESIIITKRGKPIAKLVPIEEEGQKLIEAQGWLDNEDPFFKTMTNIVEDRFSHIPRVLLKKQES